MGLFTKKGDDEPADRETTSEDEHLDVDPVPGLQDEAPEAEPSTADAAADNPSAGDLLAEIDGSELSEASDDGLDKGDDLMDIFSTTEAVNEELGALTADLEDVDAVSLLSLARQIVADSRNGSKSG